MNISVHFNASDNKIVSIVVITTSYLRPCGEQKLRDFRTPLLNKEN